MHQRCTLRIFTCAHRGKDRSDRRTDVFTHQNRNRRTDGKCSTHGKCLQDTDGCRRALNNRSQHQTGKHTKDRIGEHRQNAGKFLIARQRLYCRGHSFHTKHQNCKADQNRTDIFFLIIFSGHQHDHANDTDDW